MDFRIGIVIGASLWLVTEQQQPDNQICTRLADIAEPCGCMIETFDLICGSDARTYLSKCFLNCWATLENIKIVVAHEGGCTMEPRCTCNPGYDPVCGSNGVTYANECVFKCFKNEDNRLRLEHNGECERTFDHEEPEKQNKKPENCCCCPSNLRRFRTRFGNNGKRYARSLCGCQHERKTEAPWTPPPAKLKTQAPSCSFNNPPPIQPLKSQHCPNQPQDCLLSGPEKRAKKNRCACATLHRPVCSNHNTTYANFCVLDCIATRNPSVEFQHWGFCGNPRKTPWDYNSLNLETEKPAVNSTDWRFAQQMRKHSALFGFVELQLYHGDASPYLCSSDDRMGMGELDCVVPEHSPRNVTNKKPIGWQLCDDVQGFGA